MPRISALILGLSLAAGCSKVSPDTAPPDDGSEDMEVTTAETAQATPPRVTGVYLDPALTTVCEMERVDEVVAYDPDDEDHEVERTLAAVAACVKTGPLQGRRLHLVSHEGSDDPFVREFGKSRAEVVRDLLLQDGLSKDEVVADAGKPDDDPDAAWAWPSERRVDIRVATRHIR